MMDRTSLLPQIAIGFFCVSLLWPNPDSETYQPSVLLFLAALGGIPYIFIQRDVLVILNAFIAIVFGAIIPNILMFIATYKFFSVKAFKNYFLYLLFICIGAAGFFIIRLIVVSYLSRHPLDMIMLVKLGGVFLWYLSMILTAIVLLQERIKMRMTSK